MKKRILLIALIGMSFGINAQITELSNGNIGIGTATPIVKLQVAGDLLSQNSIIQGTNGSLWVFDRDITNRSNDSFRITKSNGNLSFSDRTYSGGFLDFYFLKHSFSNSASSTLYLNPKTKLIFQIDASEVMRLSPEGNLGIGTSNPDMKLTVNGNIHAKEVKIDLNIPAPDYVFKKDYNLRSIENVENFIKQNGHLPEIPSAKEFNQNGVMQAEMDMNLLKKIEELTLYTIQQHKGISELKEKVENLEKENNSLKIVNTKLIELQKRLEKLEKK